MSHLQVLDCAGAPKIEEIRTDSAVARTPPLSLCNMGEAMLDNDALAQNAPPSRRCDQFSQPMLKSFIIG